MRTIIAGSRSIKDYETVLEIVSESGFVISQVVSGGAKGVDTIGVQIAEDFSIPFVIFSADWDRYGRYQAGRIRNKQMAENADALIAVWNGVSSGTANMIDISRKLGLRVYIGMA